MSRIGPHLICSDFLSSGQGEAPPERLPGGPALGPPATAVGDLADLLTSTSTGSPRVVLLVAHRGRLGRADHFSGQSGPARAGAARGGGAGPWPRSVRAPPVLGRASPGRGGALSGQPRFEPRPRPECDGAGARARGPVAQPGLAVVVEPGQPLMRTLPRDSHRLGRHGQRPSPGDGPGRRVEDDR